MSRTLTITEALAELKTLNKRYEAKKQYIKQYLTRQEGFKDPLEKSGGSVKVIAQELQAIQDMRKEHLRIRQAIQQKNQVEKITVGGFTYTIAEWLTWRKEIAPDAQRFLQEVVLTVTQARNQARSKGVAVMSAVVNQTGEKPSDLLVNVDEAHLAKQIEELESVLGTLDGQLSLKNATLTVEF